MKLVIFGAIAFVVGLAATTGVVVMRAPAPQAAADSTHADSTGAAHEEPPAATPVAAAATAVPVTPDSAAPAAPTHAAPGAAPEQAALDSIEAADLGPLPDPGPDAEVYKRLSRILVTMKPASAAAILARLSDDQVEGVFRALGVRQAAALMAQLPPDRAAEMGRRMIERP